GFAGRRRRPLAYGAWTSAVCSAVLAFSSFTSFLSYHFAAYTRFRSEPILARLLPHSVRPLTIFRAWPNLPASQPSGLFDVLVVLHVLAGCSGRTTPKSPNTGSQANQTLVPPRQILAPADQQYYNIMATNVRTSTSTSASCPTRRAPHHSCRLLKPSASY